MEIKIIHIWNSGSFDISLKTYFFYKDIFNQNLMRVSGNKFLFFTKDL